MTTGSVGGLFWSYNGLLPAEPYDAFNRFTNHTHFPKSPKVLLLFSTVFRYKYYMIFTPTTTARL